MAVPTHYAALSSYLGEHVKAEEHALKAYQDLLIDRAEDVATYLVNMVLTDEVRHHQMFADMQGTLERSIGLGRGSRNTSRRPSITTKSARPLTPIA